MFVKLAELTQDGIRRKSDGSLPLDTLVQGVLDSFKIVAMVTPMPGPSSSSSSSGLAPKHESTGQGTGLSRSARKRADLANKNQKNEINRLRAENENLKRARQSAEPTLPWMRGGSSGQQDNKRGPRCPRELVNKQLEFDGKSVCYGFSLGTCPESNVVAPGDRCTRGWHICAEPGCGRNHSLKDHRGQGKGKGAKK